MPEQERPAHISKREWQQVAADIFLRHGVESHQDQRISEKDRIVEKRLREHQHKSKQRTLSMFVHNRIPNLAPRCVRARVNARGWCVMRRKHFWMRRDFAFDLSDNLFRLGV